MADFNSFRRLLATTMLLGCLVGVYDVKRGEILGKPGSIIRV